VAPVLTRRWGSVTVDVTPARGVVDVKKRWKDLSPRSRGLVVVGALLEGLLKLVALRDLKRRPANQVRGPKWLWGVVITLANSLGAVPAAYFLVGRRSRD
jgi:hypothetical protein